jgi:acyl-CoA reductase-like NAD-dependent aldehyde dehydrogenase
MAVSAETMQVFEPATEQVLAELPRAGAEETDEAVARALRVARALETGNISVNSNNSVRVTTPFGGFKQSGVGRELGPFALEHYTELKNVFIATT